MEKCCTHFKDGRTEGQKYELSVIPGEENHYKPIYMSAFIHQSQKELQTKMRLRDRNQVCEC